MTTTVKSIRSGITKYFIIGLSVFSGLYLSSQYNYLLFHSIAEGFAVVIACGIFMLSWNSREIVDNTYILFLGIAYLFVGSLDFLHAIGYLGIGIFPQYGANLGTQLWIGARYMESISLFIAPLIMERKFRHQNVLALYGIIFALLVLSIFSLDLFPVCFIEGTGLTPFKKTSEYIICVILASSIFIMLRKKEKFDADVFKLLIASLAVTILSELAFTLYISVYGLTNLIGHYLKIISFYLIYKAIIGTGLTKPYALMFRELKQRETALQESMDRYQTLFEQSADSIVIFDLPSGEKVEFNRMAHERLEYSYEEFKNISMSDIEAIETPDQIREHMSKIHKTGSDAFETRHRTKSGRIKDILVKSKVMNINGKDYIQSIWVDITQRKKVEEELMSSLSQLETANRELSEFAFIVAHDLKEPLRALNSLSKWILTDYAEKFDEAGREKMELLVNRVRRINDLVEGIHRYSRAGQLVRNKTMMDLHEIVNDVMSVLNPPDHVHITVEGTLPSLICDRSSMEQVFQNLIGNAIKYMDKTQGLISISSVSDGNFWKTCVADNGPGIAEKDHKKIFQMFHVLQPRDKVEASGVGLAVVKKIVEMHGGRVWVESEVGQGSRFYFTIPKRDN